MSNLNLSLLETPEDALLTSFNDASNVALKILKAVVPGQAPVESLRDAKGLLFTIDNSFGMGIGSIHKGSAMLIVQTEPKVGSKPVWSPPVFFTVGSGGLGFSLGSSSTESLTLLYSRASIEELYGSHFDIATRGISQSSKSNSSVPEGNYYQGNTASNAAKGLHVGEDESLVRARPEKFSITHGAVKDFTLQAEFYKKSRATTSKLYGTDRDFIEILMSGQVKPPAELKPLYDALAEFVPSVTPHNSAAPLVDEH